MLAVTQLVGFGARAAPVLTHISSNDFTTNAASHTFTAQDIGGPSTDRLVVVVATGPDSNAGGASQFTGVTIGGNAATIHVNPGGGRIPCAIASLLIATGTTADIVITRTGATGTFSIDVYTLTGYDSATPIATAGSNISTNPTTSIGATVTVNANDIAVFGASCGATGGVSWSSATEDSDRFPISKNQSAAHKFGGPGSYTETVTATASGPGAGIVAAVWF
jgi:hypothetical protein